MKVKVTREQIELIASEVHAGMAYVNLAYPDFELDATPVEEKKEECICKGVVKPHTIDAAWFCEVHGAQEYSRPRLPAEKMKIMTFPIPKQKILEEFFIQEADNYNLTKKVNQIIRHINSSL